MDSRIPVIVRMRVECPRCGHAEDDTYEFDMPFAKAQAMEAHEPGKCSKCKAPVLMHLKRTQQRQWAPPASRRAWSFLLPHCYHSAPNQPDTAEHR